MLHIALHFLIPLLFGAIFYRKNWKSAALIMVATMLVDLDHLLADPIYDPNRCSIGFHPLHTVPVIVIYLILFLLPLFWKKNGFEYNTLSPSRVVHFVGLGLIIHMFLDWMDCIF